MNAYTNKNNTGKILVAFLAMVMIVAGAVVALSSDSVNATEYQTVDALNDALDSGDVELTSEITVENTESIDIPENRTLTIGENGKITVNTGGSIDNNGTIVVPAPNNNTKLVLNGGSITGGIITSSGATATSAYGVYIQSGMITGVTFTDYRMAVVLDENAKGAVSITNCSFGNGGKAAIYIQGTDSDATVSISGNTYGALISQGAEAAVSIDLTNMDVPRITLKDSTSVYVQSSGTGGKILDIGTNLEASSITDLTVNGTDTTVSISRAVTVDNISGDGEMTVENGGSLTAGTSTIKPTNNGGTVSIADYAVTDITTLNAFGNNDVADRIVITGEFGLTGNVIIDELDTLVIENATVTLPAGTNPANASTLTVNGALETDNSYLYIPVVLGPQAQYSATGTHNLNSDGDLQYNTQVGFGDTLTMSGTISDNLKVDVFGTLVTSNLTIDGVVNAYAGSDITVNGTVTVANQFNMYDSEMELAGTITVRNDRSGSASFNLYGQSEVTVLENGTFNVNRATGNGAQPNYLRIDVTNDANGISKFIVEGTLNVTGTLEGAVQDKGTVTFNGTAGTGASIVVYDGVTLDITSVSGSMEVMDSEDVIKDYAGLEDLTNIETSVGNTVTLTDVRGVSVTVAVTEATYENEAGDAQVRTYTSDMTVSGTVSKATSAQNGSITIDGACTEITGINSDEAVIGTMTVGDMSLGRALSVTFDGNVTVAGTFNANITESSTPGDNITLTNIATSLTVTGTMVLGEGVTGFTTDHLNAVYYSVTSTGEGTAVSDYYTNFANAIAAIADADDDMVLVYGTVAVYADAEVANGMTVQVQTGGRLVIDAEATLTVADGGVFDVSAGTSQNSVADVNGVLVITNNGTGLVGSASYIDYDVLKTTGVTDTYSSLAYALAHAAAGETITLSQDVTLKTSTTIPEQVTLEVPRNTNLELCEDVVLTVDGTLAVQGGSVSKDSDTGAWGDYATITVNGVMSMTGAQDITGIDDYRISGACFVDRGVAYVTNVAYAAENVDNGTIYIMGQVSMGDVAFTEKQNGSLQITVQNIDGTADGATVVSAGTITLDGATFAIRSGTVTGTVSAAAGGATASVELNRAGAGISLESGVETDIDADVDVLYISGTINSGAVVVSEGTVTVNDTGDYDLTLNSTSSTNAQGSITIASGATLDVPETAVVYIQENMDDADANVMAVDGTVDLAGELNIRAPATVAGTVNVNDGGELVVIANTNQGDGSLSVTGTVAVTEAEDETGTFRIVDGAVVTVGVKPTDVGASTDAGTITGAVSLDISDEGASYIRAYPGSDLTGAQVNWIEATADSNTVSTVFNINGEPYMTVYIANGEVLGIETVIEAETFELVGYDCGIFYGANDGRNSILYDIENWYTSADMLPNQEVEDGSNVGTEANANVYAAVEPSYLRGVIPREPDLTCTSTTSGSIPIPRRS